MHFYVDIDKQKEADQQGIEDIPLYPEERTNHRPTSEQIFRLFSLVERHTLFENGHEVQRFEPDLTELQRQVLALLGVPESAYRRCPQSGG